MVLATIEFPQLRVDTVSMPKRLTPMVLTAQQTIVAPHLLYM